MVPRRGTIPRRSGPKQAPNPPARHGPPAVRGGGARGAPAPPAAGAGSSAHARLHEILREYAWREGTSWVMKTLSLSHSGANTFCRMCSEHTSYSTSVENTFHAREHIL